LGVTHFVLDLIGLNEDTIKMVGSKDNQEALNGFYGLIIN
jgi:hypothetical protein